MLTKLEEARLRLNKEKCWFMQSKVVYLGQVIAKTGLHPDKGPIQVITEAPRPQNVTEIKVYQYCYLIMANSYKDFTSICLVESLC